MNSMFMQNSFSRSNSLARVLQAAVVASVLMVAGCERSERKPISVSPSPAKTPPKTGSYDPVATGSNGNQQQNGSYQQGDTSTPSGSGGNGNIPNGNIPNGNYPQGGGVPSGNGGGYFPNFPNNPSFPGGGGSGNFPPSNPNYPPSGDLDGDLDGDLNSDPSGGFPPNDPSIPSTTLTNPQGGGTLPGPEIKFKNGTSVGTRWRGGVDFSEESGLMVK